MSKRTLTDIQMVAETGDHAFWMAEDEQGNVVVAGHRLIRFPAGSLEPQAGPCPDELTRVFLEDHVVTIVSDAQGPSLHLPRGERVRLPETAARGCYGEVHDSIAEKIYLLTVNSLLEVSLRSLELRTTPFEHPPDAPHAYYEELVVRHGCVATFRYGLGFWSPRGSFRRDDRDYDFATIVDPNRVVAAADRQAVDVFDASGRLIESMEAPRGRIHALDTIEGTPWIAWVEDLAGEPTIGSELTDRTVNLGGTEIGVMNVWFEDCVSYARLLTGEARTVRLGGDSASPHAVVSEVLSIVFGTMSGELVLWDTRTNDVETIEVPGSGSRRNPRIVSLLWSESRRLLFVGTRDGAVYTARVAGTTRPGHP